MNLENIASVSANVDLSSLSVVSVSANGRIACVDLSSLSVELIVNGIHIPASAVRISTYRDDGRDRHDLGLRVFGLHKVFDQVLAEGAARRRAAELEASLVKARKAHHARVWGGTSGRKSG